jgi:hypothetical protein
MMTQQSADNMAKLRPCLADLWQPPANLPRLPSHVVPVHEVRRLPVVAGQLNIEITQGEGENLMLIGDVETPSFPLAGAFPYVRIDQAVGTFGIGRASLYKSFLSGALKCFKIGRRKLLKVSDRKMWIERLQAPGPTDLQKTR